MRLKFNFVAAACVALVFTPLAYATCADEYVGEVAPRITQAAPTVVVRELCYVEFAVGHSAATHTALWSAEHLTAQEVDAAQTLRRRDSFHAESQLPAQERAVLADYARSGFDRGHLAPSGDMPTAEAQAQSFTLANMVPQNDALNRGLWAQIEGATRELAEQEGELYVVSGPVFAADSPALRGRVRVPAAMFKAIYDPHRRQAAAYVAVNASPSTYRIVSIAALRDMIGVDVFPSLSEAVKAHAMALPAPDRRRQVVASLGH